MNVRPLLFTGEEKETISPPLENRWTHRLILSSVFLAFNNPEASF
jgi:hypothetical protein